VAIRKFIRAMQESDACDLGLGQAMSASASWWWTEVDVQMSASGMESSDNIDPERDIQFVLGPVDRSTTPAAGEFWVEMGRCHAQMPARVSRVPAGCEPDVPEVKAGDECGRRRAVGANKLGATSSTVRALFACFAIFDRRANQGPVFERARKLASCLRDPCGLAYHSPSSART